MAVGCIWMGYMLSQPTSIDYWLYGYLTMNYKKDSKVSPLINLRDIAMVLGGIGVGLLCADLMEVGLRALVAG